MKKTKYYCDICGEHITHPHQELIGVYFTSHSKFVLKDHKSTDGKHICFDCGYILKDQLSKVLPGTGK